MSGSELLLLTIVIHSSLLKFHHHLNSLIGSGKYMKDIVVAFRSLISWVSCTTLVRTQNRGNGGERCVSIMHYRN